MAMNDQDPLSEQFNAISLAVECPSVECFDVKPEYDPRENLPVCVVPIKPEYLIREIKQDVSQSMSDEKSDKYESEKTKRSDKRGQNKNRRKEMAQMTTKVRASSNRLCPSAYMPNVKCRHGEKCTSEHDVSVFLSKKAPDLESECPVYEQRGYCPFSYSCRYGNAHITDDLQQMKKSIRTPYQETLNAKSMHIQVGMRKRTYELSRSEAFLNTLNDNYRNRKGARDTCRGKKGGNRSRNKECEQKLGKDAESTVIPGEDAEKILTNEHCAEDVSSCEVQNSFNKEELEMIDHVPNTSTQDITLEHRFPNKIGCMEREKKTLDLKSLAGKKYVAPLTTVGNLPFRRICVDLGADITCGEMALSTSILGGVPSEYSLVKRHPSEKVFGVQIAGGFADTMTMCSQIIADEFEVDFIDINMGCPIDVVNQKGGGCALPTRPTKLYDVMRGMRAVMGDIPLTIKIRTGIKEGVLTAHETINGIIENGCRPDMITLHPRSKEQRYSKLANWEFTRTCSQAAGETPLWACGDILSWQQYYERLETYPVHGIMMARGALIKPWLMTEIDEKRDWDITATERFDIIKKFVWYGLDHWGSDDCGVEKTRRFLLEWLSFTSRYVPIGLLEVLPQRINERPPLYVGRNELETLLSSQRANDWVKISEMLLGKSPDGFEFIPKHKARSY